MFALLILAAFASTYLVLRASFKDHDWREWFLVTSIIMGAIIALLSEILGVLHALNQAALAIFWGLYSLGMMSVVAWRSYIDSPTSRLPGEITIPSGRTSLTQAKFLAGIKSPEKLALLAIALSVILLLVTAYLAPPNTNDALYYHMSRVVNWAQRGSLEHYVTPINRQLWMPPFAEYAVLNLFLLSSSDSLSNLIQWFAMLGSLVGVSLIAGRLGAKRDGQVFAALFCLTIRMGLLQSTSTQTDYVTGFWTVCLAYLSLYAHQNGLFKFNATGISRYWSLSFLLSLTVGLGILTKGTFAAFALPFLAWLLISTLRHHQWMHALLLLFLGLGVVVLLNAGVWWRNFHTYQAPLGPRTGLHTNERFTPGVLFSNLIRNSTLHLGTAYGIVNGPFYDSVAWVHNLFGLDVDDPGTTIDTYRIRRSLHEDYAGNELHFFSIPLSLILLSSPIQLSLGQKAHRRHPEHDENSPFPASQNNSSALISYILAVLIGFVVFSLLFKWQATGSRLQLPFFVLLSPVAGAAYDRVSTSWGSYFLIGIFMLNALPTLISNPSRALVPTDTTLSILQSSRTELLFVNSPEFMPGYLSIIEAAGNTDCHRLGLEIDSSHPDYPFWALLSPPATETQIEYYTDAPELEQYRNTDFDPCAVICTICSSPQWNGLEQDSTHFGGYTLYLKEK